MSAKSASTNKTTKAKAPSKKSTARVPRTRAGKAVAAKTAAARKVVSGLPVVPQVHNHTRGFMDFVREQGVVGLAVGLAIGTAATVLVKSIVDNIVNPLIGAYLLNGIDLRDKYYCAAYKGSVCSSKVEWGVVVANFISFIAIAALIYFVVKGLKLDKLDKKKES